MIYPYEIRLSVKVGSEPAREVVRTEYSYSVMDAVLQASLNQGVDSPGAEVKLIRVSPPQVDIERAATQVTNQVELFRKRSVRDGSILDLTIRDDREDV